MSRHSDHVEQLGIKEGFIFYLIKHVKVIYRQYSLPGRTAIDEEFIISTLDGEIMPQDGYWDSCKAQSHGRCSSYEEWCMKLAAEQMTWPIFRINSTIAIHKSKPNYAHMLLDFLPEAFSMNNFLTLNHLKVTHLTGINFNAFPEIAKLALFSDQPNQLPAFPGFNCVIYPEAVLFPIHITTLDKLSAAKMALSPVISKAFEILDTLKPKPRPLIISTRNLNDKDRIFINETDTCKLLLKRISFVNFTRLSLLQSAIVMNSANNYLFPIGAETSNAIFISNQSPSLFIASSARIFSISATHKGLVDYIYNLSWPPLRLVIGTEVPTHNLLHGMFHDVPVSFSYSQIMQLLQVD
ncbi:glycosyltransferase 61 family protein [Rheinheimera sp.]|uniref:glycosyltransferase 61 family protein n=1 Tax=Rheinheimera sp. TaxID=1869214 RepID=UPI00404818EA